MAREQRFQIQSPQRDVRDIDYRGEMAVVSLAISRALASEQQEGTWTVLEYGEPIYHVRKGTVDGGLLMTVSEAQAS